jgi:hypothetical protein
MIDDDVYARVHATFTHTRSGHALGARMPIARGLHPSSFKEPALTENLLVTCEVLADVPGNILAVSGHEWRYDSRIDVPDLMSALPSTNVRRHIVKSLKQIARNR